MFRKKFTAKSYSFLVIDSILFGRIYKLIMTTDDKFRDEKMQYDINRGAA